MLYKEFVNKMKKLHKFQMKLMKDEEIYKEFENYAKSIGINYISCYIVTLILKKEIEIDDEKFTLILQFYDNGLTIQITNEKYDEVFYIRDLQDEMILKDVNTCEKIYKKFSVERLLEQAEYYISKISIKKNNIKQKLLKYLYL